MLKSVIQISFCDFLVKPFLLSAIVSFVIVHCHFVDKIPLLKMNLAGKPTGVYTSLSQTWEALIAKRELPEVKFIVDFCKQMGLVDSSENLDRFESQNSPKFGHPFVVIEGLDGTGKTTLTKYLSTRLNMKWMCTPPKHNAFIKPRDFFDDQPEPLRRAYYSIGNYLAAHEVMNSNQPVVMDRFWHSTVAYFLAHQIKDDKGSVPPNLTLTWPKDLLQPDLVVFLQVSEAERLRRHSTRANFTNTKEEQILADDEQFRKNVATLYRSVNGPKFVELIVDGEQKNSEKIIFDTVLNLLPELTVSKKIKSHSHE